MFDMCARTFTSPKQFERRRGKYWSHSWENLSSVTQRGSRRIRWNLEKKKLPNKNKIYYEFMDMYIAICTAYSWKFKHTHTHLISKPAYTGMEAGIHFNSCMLALNAWNLKWIRTDLSWLDHIHCDISIYIIASICSMFIRTYEFTRI